MLATLFYFMKVRDLLNPASNKKGGLKVRQHPAKGFYGERFVDRTRAVFLKLWPMYYQHCIRKKWHSVLYRPTHCSQGPACCQHIDQYFFVRALCVVQLGIKVFI